MKLKMFDYKFMLIIVLSMIVYFLYRRIESVESKVKKIENNNFENEPQPIELPLPEENFELPLPVLDENKEGDSVDSQDNNHSVDTVQFEFNSNLNNQVTTFSPNSQDVELPSNNDLVKLQVIDNELDNVNNVNILKVVDDETNNINIVSTLEEYSNEHSDENNSEDDNDVQIYSNDNDEEDHTSLMESLVEAVDKEESNPELNNLLKNNKLPELQEMAEQLSIDIHKGNNKKKTKLELATDILNSKK